MIVVDASAIGTFLIPDEAGAFARFANEVCQREAMVRPAHWHVEVANLIHKADRRGRLTGEQAAACAATADAIGANVAIAPTQSIALLVAEGARLQLSAYDTASFLAAQSRNLPLLTDDGALRRAALAEGLEVLTP